MKRKNQLSENATKGDLLILKQELKEEIVGKINEKNEKYKYEVLTKLDDIAGQLGSLREENIIRPGQTSQLREQVEDHEKRIKHLEKIQQIA